MNSHAPFFTAVLLGAFLLAPNSFAHAPFDASSRAIVHEDYAEVSVTVGAALAEKFLRTAQLTPGQLLNGHPLALNPELVTNFFATSADGKILPPRAADVITDGVEFEFHFDYALAAAKNLRLEAKFLPALNGSRTVLLVLTDENGNILGSSILAPGKAAAEFALPAPPPVASDRLKVEGSEPATRNLQPATNTPSFIEFLKLGIGHILNVDAFDHLLFLIALLLGCRKLKTMLLVITGFTVAHSVTLTLAALNWVNVSPRLIEPMIAASIIFVALENFRSAEKSWRRYALTCGFGLIHGFGFASSLRESGLGGNGLEIVRPLLGFNLGVEIGQLVVAAVVLPLLLGLNRWPWFARHGVRMISGLVILVATVWLWERLR
jgi:hypothetical protein